MVANENNFVRKHPPSVIPAPMLLNGGVTRKAKIGFLGRER
jgi:hypothetical protein